MAREWKLFDPRDPACGTGGAELLDSTVVRRGDRWWMYLAGQAAGYGAPDLFSASLPPGAPLAPTGWSVHLEPLAPGNAKGGRHCPSYVSGWDPHRRRRVERLYYAEAAGNVWGPYTIGFLEWDGGAWVAHSEPVFRAVEPWEHGSVYEPNLLYHDGKWKMWYVAGSNHEDYLVHGYAESDDGVSWGAHTLFAPPEMKMFDFCVRERPDGFEAVFSRVWVGGGTPPAETGLWWCRADRPSPNLADWSRPVQILPAGPWKPSLARPESGPALIFFDRLYRTDDPGPFPFAFTLHCLETVLPPATIAVT
jgi:hypothetical protein